MGSSPVYAPYIHTQSVASDTWTIEHNFGRKVNVQVWVGNIPVDADITPLDDNSFTVEFFEGGVAVEKTGYVVVS